MSTLFIKNMVCDRCRQVVQKELEQLGITVEEVTLGEVDIADENPDKPSIAQALEKQGFELLNSRKDWQVEQIKNAIIQFVRMPDAAAHLTFSGYLQEKLQTDYHLLSTLFSDAEGITIQQYLILQRIERVKELLTYDELTVGQIAEQVSYRNSAHLSAQFKKITGLTPSQFKKLKKKRRKPLDKVIS